MVAAIGYDNALYGFDSNTCAVISSINKQSGDIAMGVDTGGAGDQGMMFGYACRETPELMPAPLYYAHEILRNMRDRRIAGDHSVAGLLPDAKSQVTLRYVDGKPVGATSIVVSTQHLDAGLSSDDVQHTLIRAVHAALAPTPDSGSSASDPSERATSMR